MADSLVADYVDHRRLTRGEGALQCRHDLVTALDVLAMASHLGEDLVVANASQHVEGFGTILEHRHRFEAWTPRAVVPDNTDHRQLVAGRSFHIEAANADAAVAADHHYLRPRPRQLHADPHPYSVAHWSQRPGIDDLTWKARRHP